MNGDRAAKDIELVDRVLERTRAKGLFKRVLLALAVLADSDGTVATPPHGELARRTDLPVEDIPALLNRLTATHEIREVNGVTRIRCVSDWDAFQGPPV